MRVKASIAYNGSKFYGFQRLKTTNKTVSQSIEEALSSLGVSSKIIGSGRTDKGVHATGQVIHFNIPIFWQKKSLQELKQRLNQKLKFIQFKHIKVADSNFHAQYCAKVRVYRYLIKTTPPTVFEKEFISYYKIKNLNLFLNALKLYKGEHNFKNFKKEGSPTSSDIREIYKIKFKRVGKYYAIYFFANGYLRSQIRLMIGGAILAQQGKISLKELQEQIDCKYKSFSTLAQANGLYLAKILY